MCSSIQLCEAAFSFSSFGYSFSCTFNLVAPLCRYLQKKVWLWSVLNFNTFSFLTSVIPREIHQGSLHICILLYFLPVLRRVLVLNIFFFFKNNVEMCSFQKVKKHSSSYCISYWTLRFWEVWWVSRKWFSSVEKKANMIWAKLQIVSCLWLWRQMV